MVSQTDKSVRTGNSRPNGARATRGFTLVELVVTVAIVGILASIALPLVGLERQRSKEQELQRALREIRDALDAYKQAADDGRILKTLEESGYPKSLDVLVQGVRDARDPNGRKIFFLRRLPRDPMHSDLQVPPAQTWGLRSYVSEADAPRPGDDVYDIYSLAPGTGLNGISYRKW